MLKHYSYGIKRAIMLVDVIILLFAYFVSLTVRFRAYGPGFENLVWILLVSSFVYPIAFP